MAYSFEEFAASNEGFRLSASGQYRGVDTPDWRTCLLEEWWGGEFLTGSSICFIICVDGNGKESSLLGVSSDQSLRYLHSTELSRGLGLIVYSQ